VSERPSGFPLPTPRGEELDASEQLVLSDLLNHVLDRGVVISGQVIISVADIDLVALDLRLVLSAVESAMQRGDDALARAARRGPPATGDAR
jgi:hypothetical protein